jgi:hypothetical protein
MPVKTIVIAVVAVVLIAANVILNLMGQEVDESLGDGLTLVLGLLAAALTAAAATSQGMKVIALLLLSPMLLYCGAQSEHRCVPAGGALTVAQSELGFRCSGDRRDAPPRIVVRDALPLTLFKTCEQGAVPMAIPGTSQNVACKAGQKGPCFRWEVGCVQEVQP